MKYVFAALIVCALVIVIMASIAGDFMDGKSTKPHDSDDKYDYE